MATVRVDAERALHCAVDDLLWPWDVATPVVMLHGYARNARFWDRWVPAVAERHRVYRPELYGCGASDVPEPGWRCTGDAILADVLAVLDAMGLARVHWVGESSGGLIGLMLAAARPERVASLVLCNAPTRISDTVKRVYALDRASAAAAILAHGVGPWCRSTLEYRLDLAHAAPELADWYVAEMDRTPAHVAAAMIECFEAVDLAPLLGRVGAPVLLLCGDRSPIAAEQQAAMAAALPNGRLELLEGYGHGINLLQPARCAAAALAFWGGA